MNLRRGARRAYLTLTITWVALVMLTVLSGRWQPWIQWTNWVNPGPWQIEREQPTTESGTLADLRERWLWTAGMSILPPALGYLLFFQVGPWIYRGFRSGTQT